ncbi:hypothetical protein [Alkalisalibacterium limincola]|uniref:Uncharacterized protein n=1 Tax=Alkalisalibacterium limincola TaxID=2699169 RepID=A0A5C8KXM9_9GAMM|nr:hypothetical protein [Alkalisalibacterium limincola]TXK64343.1 hypothetical protein FU658_05430 [Alkalisalibacterium limincola]
MDMLRVRISGPRSVVDQLVFLLGDIQGVERVEVIDDLMPHMDDEDSSSAGLAENQGDEVAQVEIEAEDEATLVRARDLAFEGARRAGLALEVVEEF